MPLASVMAKLLPNASAPSARSAALSNPSDRCRRAPASTRPLRVANARVARHRAVPGNHRVRNGDSAASTRSAISIRTRNDRSRSSRADRVTSVASIAIAHPRRRSVATGRRFSAPIARPSSGGIDLIVATTNGGSSSAHRLSTASIAANAPALMIAASAQDRRSAASIGRNARGHLSVGSTALSVRDRQSAVSSVRSGHSIVRGRRVSSVPMIADLASSGLTIADRDRRAISADAG